MHSNNDGMPDDWKPTPNDPFENFMNDKKISYMQNNSGTFNTVHVTEWAHDYVRKLERDLAAEKARALKLVEALNRLSVRIVDNLKPHGDDIIASRAIIKDALSAYSTDSGDGVG